MRYRVRDYRSRCNPADWQWLVGYPSLIAICRLMGPELSHLAQTWILIYYFFSSQREVAAGGQKSSAYVR